MQPADAKPIRVLLVDDHQLLTGALSQMMSLEPDLRVVGVAGSVAEAKAMSRDRVDVVLMDYRLPDGTGAEATRAIKARWPAARVVMLTALNDDETVLDAIVFLVSGNQVTLSATVQQLPVRTPLCDFVRSRYRVGSSS